MLTIQQLKKSFGNHLIIEVKDLSFEKGIHWIKGANGAGKSTFFKCLAGLSTFNGEVTWNKYSLKNNPTHYKKQVSIAQAEPVFPNSLTGKEVFNYFAKLLKASVEQQTSLKGLFQLNAYLNNSITSYSSGMAKKLGLCLAFLGSPQLVILDEPFNALDSEARNALHKLMQQKLEEGVSFIISTHQDFQEVIDMPTTNWLLENKTIRPE